MKRLFICCILMVTIVTGCTNVEKELILEEESRETLLQEDKTSYEDPEDTSKDYDKSSAENPGEKSGEDLLRGSADITKKAEKLFVYVCGAVNSPGVYEMPPGSRWNDCLLAAGGFTDDARETAVNLAAPVSDGERIFFPTVQEAGEDAVSGFGDGTNVKSDGKVDINRATEAELMTLTGVGEKTAARIIDYRTEHGKFEKIDDIMKVSGIKQGLFSKIKDSITAG